MNNTSKIMIAVAAGVAAGVAVGLLFAPEKGSKTRRKMNKQGRQMAEDLKDTLRKGKEKINDLKEDIEKTVRDKVKEFS